MGPEDWLERYRKRFAERARITEEDAADGAPLSLYDELSCEYKDDPEGAADAHAAAYG